MWGVRVALLALATVTGLPALAAEKAPLEPDRVSIYRESPKSYAGLGLFASAVDNGAGLNQSPGGLHIRMGGMIDPHWGAEVRLARGFWHESNVIGGTKVQLDIDHIAGAYLTTRWPFAVPLVRIPGIERMFFEAHAGLASVQLRAIAEIPNSHDPVSRHERTDMSWGAGLGVEVHVPKVDNKIGLSLEYMDYGSKDNLSINAVEAGFQVFF